MNIPNEIKRGRGRPRKSEIKPQEEQPEPVVVVETPPEPIVIHEHVVKKTRKVNRWIEHCTEVKNRAENTGISYREILKIAKTDYQK
jgi:hypothetical protein